MGILFGAKSRENVTNQTKMVEALKNSVTVNFTIRYVHENGSTGNDLVVGTLTPVSRGKDDGTGRPRPVAEVEIKLYSKYAKQNANYEGRETVNGTLKLIMRYGQNSAENMIKNNSSQQAEPVSEGTNKIPMNGLRNIVKQIIKEETMLNESTSNLLAVLEKLQKSEISGQKETFNKSPEKLVNEIKSLLDKYFKGNVKSLPNGNTYWYIKNQEPFLTITGHDDGKGKGLKANIGIVKELQKIDDYLKYQEVYDEVMRAYIVDNNLTTTNKFWMFDKLPNQLHSSELGIQTSGQQQPVNERLMKGLTKREKTLKEAVLKALK